MGENGLISKELYQKIKKMSKDELLSVLKNARLAGKAAALKETEAVNINLEKIRSEICEIKGINEALADKVITILKENLS